MNYKTFDKLQFRKSSENILYLLKTKPYSLDELSKLMGLDRTSIHYQVKKLEKSGSVKAKGLGKRVYYGLKKKARGETLRAPSHN